MFEEETFLYALTARPEDARRFSQMFKPEWLNKSEYNPVLAEIYAFTRKNGEPPSLVTLHKIFKDKDEGLYNLRYKKALDEIQSKTPDRSEMLYTLEQAKDVAVSRSFMEMIRSESFLQNLEGFEGTVTIKNIESWLSQFANSGEDRTMDIRRAVDTLLDTAEFNPINIRVPTHIDALDEWTGGGLRKKQLAIIIAPTGHGKCHGKGTKILLYSGQFKNVEDIKSGEILMGPDSQPRKVLQTWKGFGPMYKVTPIKGESFLCNENHVLSLVRTDTGKVLNIPVKGYLELSKTQKHLLKLYKSPCLDFNENAKNKDVEVDPYIVGALKTLVKNNERFIPENYLISSKENRLRLLAGLLDTDGHLYDNCYEISCKDKSFQDQILFLARSLGLGATRNKDKKIKGKSYYRTTIYGDVDIIPCKSKIASKRNQKKNPLRTGFTVERVNDSEHYGFELDKDHLYILEDFTVTHNSAMLLTIGHKIATIELKNVWIITNELVLEEVTERELARLTGIDVGKIMDDPTVAYTGLERHWKNGLDRRLMISEYTRETSVDDLEAEMAKMANLYGWKPDVIILDYMERMKPSLPGHRRESEWVWIGAVARDLVRLAKKHNLLIWTAAQTNREGLTNDELDMSMAQSSIRHLQEATAVIAMNQVDIPNSDKAVLKLKPLKMRQSKRSSRSINLECDLSRMSITNKQIKITPVEDGEEDGDTQTPRQKQQRKKSYRK